MSKTCLILVPFVSVPGVLDCSHKREIVAGCISLQPKRMHIKRERKRAYRLLMMLYWFNSVSNIISIQRVA